jgi:hypothetical protein
MTVTGSRFNEDAGSGGTSLLPQIHSEINQLNGAGLADRRISANRSRWRGVVCEPGRGYGGKIVGRAPFRSRKRPQIQVELRI